MTKQNLVLWVITLAFIALVVMFIVSSKKEAPAQPIDVNVPVPASVEDLTYPCVDGKCA